MRSKFGRACAAFAAGPPPTFPSRWRMNAPTAPSRVCGGGGEWAGRKFWGHQPLFPLVRPGTEFLAKPWPHLASFQPAEAPHNVSDRLGGRVGRERGGGSGETRRGKTRPQRVLGVFFFDPFFLSCLSPLSAERKGESDSHARHPTSETKKQNATETGDSSSFFRPPPLLPSFTPH